MADARVGIAGFGLAGEVFHAPLLDAVDNDLAYGAVVAAQPLLIGLALYDHYQVVAPYVAGTLQRPWKHH